jgi:class 3 adenylate cyclase
LSRVDVTELLPQIKARTLVMSNADLQYVTKQMSIDLAAQIPGARYISHPGTLDNDTAGQPAILDFLEGGDVSTPTTREPESSGTAIILFADIVDSSALTERLGDDAFRQKARQLDAAMRAAIGANGGTAVDGKTLGDGVLAVFSAARQAISCAQACHGAAGEAGLELHAGIHAGDVIRESDNVYGGTVNIAARVAGTSAAGETLVSQTVRDLARTSAGVTFEDRGDHSLKGIEEPIRLYVVRTQS